MNICAFWIFNVCFLVILILCIVLMALSYGVVDYNEVALKKSTYSKSVSGDTVYKPGRYFTGVTGTFIRYDSTY